MNMLIEKMEQELTNEPDLTISIMRQVIFRLELTDPELLYAIYETVVHWTGDHPEDHGWGTSDTNSVVEAVQRRLTSLHAG